MVQAEDFMQTRFTQLGSGDKEMLRAMMETDQHYLVAQQQGVQLAMDVVTGLFAFSDYLSEQFIDVVLFVEEIFLHPGSLSQEQMMQVALRLEVLRQRLDEIEMKVSLQLLDLL